MTWTIRYHRLIHDDLRSVSGVDQQRIRRAIESRLGADPESCGKPLSGELRGFWRLRVGDWRVIYRIHRDVVEVFVVKIGARKDFQVYLDMAKRLRLL